MENWTKHSVQSWQRHLVFCHHLITLSALASNSGGMGIARFLRFDQSLYGIEIGDLAADGADALFGIFK